MPVSTPVTERELQQYALDDAERFLNEARSAGTPKDAADWSLAAKNASHVALTCEQIRKTREARR